MEIGSRFQSNNFFRSKLLSMTDPDEINEFLQEMQKEQTEMRYTISTMMWHMRGSLSREEAWTLCPEERNDILILMKEHKELTEKTGLALL